MSLESATYLDDLVVTNPAAGDLVSQGDDHLRLIKAALKTSFPGTTAPRYLEQARADVASAETPALWATTTGYVNITGTTAILGFASGASGQTRLLRFDGVVTLTYHATTLRLPTSANIVTAAGDHAIVQCNGTTSNTVVAYFRADGTTLTPTLPSTGEVTWEMLEDEVFNQAPATIAVDDVFPFADIDDGTTPGIKKVALVSQLLALAPGALMAIIEDQKAQDATGGIAQTGDWYVRTLNTLVYSREDLVTLSSNNFTLPVGEYYITWETAFGSTNETSTRIYDYTNSAAKGGGVTCYFDVNRDQKGTQSGSIFVSCAAPTAFNLQYRCSNAAGLGYRDHYQVGVFSRIVVTRA